MLIAPGLQCFAAERFFLDRSAQVPLYEEVGRGGRESRWNALVQLRWAFWPGSRDDPVPEPEDGLRASTPESATA